MGVCGGAAPALLQHVCLLLAVYSGAGLVMSARLKRDPSLYVAARELFPAEYGAACALLPLLSAAQLLLAHLALLACACTRAPRRRRLLLYIFAGGMVAVVCGQVSWATWTWRRVHAWLGSEQAQAIGEAFELQDHVRPILDYLGRWHPLPEKINAIMQEAQEDGPRSGYLGGGALLALLVLQLASVLLALLALLAARTDRHDYTSARSHSVNSLDEGSEFERKPLQKAQASFVNGRLVLAAPA